MTICNTHLPSIFNLACNLEKLNEFAESRKWFEHAIKVKPDWPDALYGLSLVCIKLNSAYDAIKYVKRAIEIEGKSAPVHLKYTLALAYRENGQLEKAS